MLQHNKIDDSRSFPIPDEPRRQLGGITHASSKPGRIEKLPAALRSPLADKSLAATSLDVFDIQRLACPAIQAFDRRRDFAAEPSKLRSSTF